MILLDTNALLWLLEDDPHFGRAARGLVAAGPVRYSAVSIVETTIKTMLGKLRLPGSVTDAAQAAGLTELPLTSAHAEAMLSRPELARHDPFDRMLLAQAQVEGMRLLTSDAALRTIAPQLTVDVRT